MNPGDPYNQNPWNNPGNQYGYQQPNYLQMPRGPLPVPNANLVLIFGIISIVTAFCYGVIGLALGITAIILAKKGRREYEQNPGMYDHGSYNNLNAGRICAIVGVIVGSLILIAVIVYIIFIVTLIGTVANSFPQTY